MGEKTREIIFSRHTHIASKNDGKKSSGKSAKTRFFYKYTNIVTKKLGGKKSEINFFPETHVYRGLKRWKKSSGQSAKTSF